MVVVRMMLRVRGVVEVPEPARWVEPERKTIAALRLLLLLRPAHVVSIRRPVRAMRRTGRRADAGNRMH